MYPEFGVLKLLVGLAIILAIVIAISVRKNSSHIITYTSEGCGMASTYSVDELTTYADVIVIGKVEKLDRVINLDRDSSFRQASVHYLILGQFYQVKIDTVVKGKVPEPSFSFAQPEGYLRKEQHSEELSPRDVELARKSPSCHLLFDENHRYLLFLDSIAGLDYLLPLKREPWRFDVTDEFYVSPNSVASGDMRPNSLATLLQQIDAAMHPTPEATFVSPLSPLSPLSPIATPPSS